MKGPTKLLWLCFMQIVLAIDIDWENSDSIKAGARIAADGMLSYYTGNLSGQTPGLLPGPYYWWEAGGMWGAMVDYYHYTGDDTYNAITMQALQFQVGDHKDYMPLNETASLGNDDQAFWAMAALRAAETNFPNPAPDQPSWLALAQAVFNEQVSRWDTKFCNGGIRWQIYPQNNGYTLKNSISNGALFNIAARLARYTGDDMYAQWAVKIWDWMRAIGLVDANYNVFDNSEADHLNCSQVVGSQWVYNAGTMLMGASTMYNYTNGSSLWYSHTSGLLSTLAFDFFPNGTMKDICEQNNVCNVDQRSFKAYLSRWMAASTQMAPFTYNTSYPLLVSSAKAAAAQCIGSPTGSVCGLKWYTGAYDGTNGVGQQMAALEVMLGTLVKQTVAPVTNSSGGTSVGDPHAGYNSSSIPPGLVISPARKRDRVGAWFLTALLSVGAMWCWAFMSTGVFEGRGGKPTVGGRRARASRMWERNGIWKGKGKEIDAGESGVVEEVQEVQRPDNATVVSERAVRSHGERVVGDRSRVPIMRRPARDDSGSVVGDRRSVPIFNGGDMAT